MVIGPGQLSFLAHLLGNFLRKLGSKAERMDSVCEDMPSLNRCVEIIVQIVDVHIAVAETPSRCNVEVAHDLVHTNSSLNTTPLVSLRVQSLCIVFSLALLYILTTSKSPGYTGIRLSYFVASITAASFLCVRWRIRAVTSTTIIRVQMRSFFVSVRNEKEFFGGM